MFAHDNCAMWQFMGALEKGVFNEFGFGHLEAVYADSPKCSDAIPGLHSGKAGFRQVHGKCSEALLQNNAQIGKKNFQWDIICHTPPYILSAHDTKVH
jgi:hypothetical protein